MNGNGPFTKKITKELLDDMYLIKKMKMQDIADFFGCSLTVISHRIKYFGIKPTTQSKYLNKLFGKLTPKEVAGKNKYRTQYNCECECGRFIVVDSCSLITSNTTSCGCDSRKRGKEHPLWSGHEDISSSYWSSIEKGAKDRNLEFSITIEDAWNQFVGQNKQCALTKLPLLLAPVRRLSKMGFQTASLDRINSQKGYIIDNIQWVHKDVNVMKWNFTENRYIEICKLVAQNN